MSALALRPISTSLHVACCAKSIYLIFLNILSCGSEIFCYLPAYQSGPLTGTGRPFETLSHVTVWTDCLGSCGPRRQQYAVISGDRACWPGLGAGMQPPCSEPFSAGFVLPLCLLDEESHCRHGTCQQEKRWASRNHLLAPSPW